MKLIFGFLMFVAAVAITGGLYLSIRKPERKQADLEKLISVCSQIANRLQQFGDYLVRLAYFAISVFFILFFGMSVWELIRTARQPAKHPFAAQ